MRRRCIPVQPLRGIHLLTLPLQSPLNRYLCATEYMHESQFTDTIGLLQLIGSGTLCRVKMKTIFLKVSPRSHYIEFHPSLGKTHHISRPKALPTATFCIQEPS